MRFMIMHKNDPKTEAGLPPDMEIVQKMGVFVGDHAKAGRLVDGAGLAGSATRTRLTFRNGQSTRKNGPYLGEHELPAATATESGGRSAKQKADLTRLKTEMTKAGVLVRAIAIAPSAKAKRLVFTNNDMRTIDGPFTESKELIGGFAVLELAGFDDAIGICRPYAAILGGNLEIDVRLVDAHEA